MINQDSKPKNAKPFTTDLFQILGAQQSKIMVASFNKDGYFQSAWVSAELEKLYGLRSAEFEGKHLKDFYSPADAQRKLENIRRTIELKTTVKEVSHFSTARGDFWQEITLMPSLGSSDDSQVISIAMDITDIRIKEHKVNYSMAKHLKYKKGNTRGFMVCNETGKLLQVNEKLAEILGDGSPEALMKRVSHVKELIHPIDGNVDQFWLSSAKPSSQIMVVDILHKNGSLKRLKMGKSTSSNFGIAAKKLVHLFFNDPQISAKTINTERSDTEFLLALLGGLSDIHINVFNRQGRTIAHWWPELMWLTGKTPPTVLHLGAMLHDVLPEKEALRKLSLLNDVLNTNQACKEEFHLEDQFNDNWFEMTISPMRLPSGEEYGIVMGRDITDRKRAEEERLKLERQIYQGQKMEAIGRIAAGIAHDFGNRLSVILGYGTVLKTILREDAGVTDKLEKLIQATEQAAKLTKQLLTFAQKDVHQNTVVDVHQQIQNTLDILEHSLDKRIKLTMELTAIESKVIADENHIQNVFFNLILNAGEAMSRGGKLTIRTENVTLAGDEPALASFPITKGKHLCISVTDTGKGMDAEELSRIFEPFYSTKPFAKGTGLGLASVYGTVTQCKGAITVESEVDKGSTFRLLLPVSSQCDIQTISSPEPSKMVPGSGSIFIVDDEKQVLDMMADCLRIAGYTVTACGDAVEALKHIRRHHQSLDLVLLDLMMPVLSGKQVYTALRKINPNLKVLIVSAYGQSGMIKEVLEAGAIGVVEKPVTAAKLTHAVADALV